MKIYEYTPNDDGFEDGVFGGHSTITRPRNVHTGSLGGPGLFGYGMTAAVSRSLFNNNSIEFITSLPAELNDYSGDVNLAIMGSELAPITASAGGGFSPVIYPSNIGFKQNYTEYLVLASDPKSRRLTNNEIKQLDSLV